MRIVFLLESADGLWGGVKNALEAANRLADRGHAVTVLAKSPPPDWLALRAGFTRVPDFAPERFPEADLVVATYWTTVPFALAAAGRDRVVHYCQGYEGDAPENAAQRERIERVYGLEVPKITISPHLVALLRERFAGDVIEVRYAIDHEVMRPAPALCENRPVRVGLVGPYEIEWKDLKTGIEACALASQAGLELTLVRACNTQRHRDELALPFEVEWHERVPPESMGELYRGLDVFLATSSGPEEGFFLPAVEAMACGVPCVLTDIPCFRGYGEGQYALFVPPRDPSAMAEAMVLAARVPDLREALREQGLAVAASYSWDRHIDELERALTELVAAAPSDGGLTVSGVTPPRAVDSPAPPAPPEHPSSPLGPIAPVGASASAAEAIVRARLAKVGGEIVEALKAVAEAHLGGGDYAGAISNLDAACRLSPDDPELIGRLAHACYLAGDDAAASAYYERLIELDADRADVNASRALIELTRGATAAAAEAFARAIELGDDSAETANNLGVAQYKSGDVEAARRSFLRALEREPSHPEANDNLRALEDGAARAP